MRRVRILVNLKIYFIYSNSPKISFASFFDKMAYASSADTYQSLHDTSTFVGHFVSSPREREKSNRRDSRRVERDEEQE